jgi:MFS family permease
VSPLDRRLAGRSVTIAALTLAVQNGVYMSFAVLYLPLIDEFRGTRAEVATVHSAVLLLGGLGSPMIGWAFDRLGPRRLFQYGAVVAAIGFLLASRAHSLPELVLTYGIVGGFGLAMLGSQANMIVAALWYPATRGRAIALVDLGTGAGAFAFLPLAQALVDRVGWRGTLLVWVALLLAVVVPLNVLQRLPPRSPVDVSNVSSPARWTLGTALRSPAFWWLAAMRFCGACAFPVMNTHMVAYAIGQGIAPERAATALGAVSLVSLVGRFSTGALSDRIGRAPTLTLAYASAALGIGCLSMLSLHGAGWWLVLYVVWYGLAQGSTGIIGSARTADIFAGPTFGSIFGWVALAIGPGEAFGAWVGGRIYDGAGSYLPAFAFVIVALAGGVFAIWRVRAEPRASSTLAS